MTNLRDEFYPLTKRDVTRAGIMLADSFKDDPVWNKLFAGESNMDVKYPAFFEVPLRHSLKFGHVYAISDKLEGIACWVPSRYINMGLWSILRTGALGAAMRMGANAGKKMAPLGDVLTKTRQEYMGDRPFIYLFTLGVATEHQGKGYGGKLLRTVLSLAETEDLPVYLETETEQNVRLYEKFGFQVLEKMMIPHLGLPMWAMCTGPA